MSNRNEQAILRGGRVSPVTLVRVYLPCVVLLAAVWVFSLRSPDYPIEYFVRDPSSVVGAPFFLGIMSQFGVAIFFAGAVISFLAAAALKDQPGQDEWRRFFFWGGVVAAILSMDDMTLFHEEIWEDHVAPFLGVGRTGEKAVIACYIAMMAAFLIRFRRTILRSEWGYLGLAFLFLGFCQAVDRGVIGGSLVKNAHARILLEDGSKFLGIVGWTHYFFRTALARLRLARNEEADPASVR